MTGVRYKIPMLSAKAILAYAKPVGKDIYSFNLNKAETASVLLNHGDTYQDDNGVFYQLMSMLHRDGYSPKDDELIIDDLYDAIIYLDFGGIFDRSAEFPKNALRQKKAESMFRPEGITLDLGSGQHKYLAFERSASMSRNAKLSFVRADLYDEITRRITLNLKIDVYAPGAVYSQQDIYGLLFITVLMLRVFTTFMNSIAVHFQGGCMQLTVGILITAAHVISLRTAKRLNGDTPVTLAEMWVVIG